MTTRAGAAGLLAGLIITIIIFPLFITLPEMYLQGGPLDYTSRVVIMIGVLLAGTGFFAALWSRSAQPPRCAALGALSGGLAGMIVFCLWGAALAGSARWLPQLDIVSAILIQTIGMFLALFLGGISFGALGGWLSLLNRPKHADVFDKEAPQMAMNVSITTVPASLFAVALAAAIFPRLANLPGSHSFLKLPLLVSMLLALFSQLALTLVIPHEAHQAEHRSGMDEVKMGALVGIVTAPALILLLFLIDPRSTTNPLVIASMLASVVMSLVSLRTLLKRILPGRTAFPAPQPGKPKAEALLFGSIARSRALRLVLLCVGCGMAMVLPVYVCVISLLINLNNAGNTQLITKIDWCLFLTQALISLGLMAAASAVLTLIYMFYLNLGRWFSKWHRQSRKG
jgi:hypothetical protein